MTETLFAEDLINLEINQVEFSLRSFLKQVDLMLDSAEMTERSFLMNFSRTLTTA